MPGLPYVTRTTQAPVQPGVAVAPPQAPSMGGLDVGHGSVTSAGGQTPAPMLQPGAQRPTRYVAPPLSSQARAPVQASMPAAQAQTQSMDQPMAAPQGLIRGAVRQ